MKTLFKTLTATLALWIIPLWVWLFGDSEINRPMLMAGVYIAPCLALLACVFYKKSSWIILIWAPLAAFLVVKTLFSGVTAFLVNAMFLGSAEAEKQLGIFLFPAALAVATFRNLPHTFPSGLLITISAANTVAVWLFTSSIISNSTAQSIIFHIMDPQGQPVSDVTAHYENERYGKGGRAILDGTGGPLLSDKHGILIIPSQRLRQQTSATFTKLGYRDVSVKVEMQNHVYEKERNVLLNTYRTTTVSRGTTAYTEPLSVWLYLSPVADVATTKSKHLTVRSKPDVGDAPPRYLDLATGRFNTDGPGDLKLEMSSTLDEIHPQHSLRVTGLNGAELQWVRSDLTFTNPPSSYEQMYQIAPQTGYKSEILLPGSNRQDGFIYIRTQNGNLYDQLELDAFGSLGKLARYSGLLRINSSGSRLFEP